MLEKLSNTLRKTTDKIRIIIEEADVLEEQLMSK
jgi:hypothetical protein